MNKKQQLAVLRRQVKQMLLEFENNVLQATERALKSSSVPAEYKSNLENDSYLLAKAVIDSKMRERPFAALSPQTKKEFEKIHTCI